MMALQKQHSLKCLGDLIAWDRPVAAALAGIPVAGLSLDSRLVATDEVFIACKGAAVDGRNFIREAIATGAAAVLAEKDQLWQEDGECESVPVLVVEKLGQKVSEIAARFYSQPSQQLPVVGITGTNGKTTCTQLIAQLLQALNKRCAVIGTLGVGVDGVMEPGINTTPDALSIQAHLAKWRDDAVDAVAMEVSSHGLDQGRVAALHFDVAVFTNLSRDHLDYHGSMQAYGESKLQLFRQPGLRVAVVNLDDPFAQQVLAAVAADVDVITYSLHQESASLSAKNIVYGPQGVEAELFFNQQGFALHSQLLGDFNLSNLLACLATLVAKGYGLESLMPVCKNLRGAEGRMEALSRQAAMESDVEVVVDYAHTPEALASALNTLRLHCKGKLWCVFGCGGDRDQGKRPQMGALAEQLADQVVLTSDNPRSESAAAILGDIVAGMDGEPYLQELDRAAAIARVIAEADAGDVILLAGKGHENYQQVGEQRLPFSDIQQARLALRQRLQGGPS
jgi:UDP-N-acetylmuramoyl-L-alanyl-D-glutamate--2,6-diaminopimelate ligase